MFIDAVRVNITNRPDRQKRRLIRHFLENNFQPFNFRLTDDNRLQKTTLKAPHLRDSFEYVKPFVSTMITLNVLVTLIYNSFNLAKSRVRLW